MPFYISAGRITHWTQSFPCPLSESHAKWCHWLFVSIARQRPLIKTKWSGWERVNVLLDVYCIILERSRNQVLFMFVIVWHSWLNVSSVSLFLRRRRGHFVGPGDICLLLADVSQSSFCPVTDWTTNEGPCCTAVCRRLAQIAPETVSAYLRCIWFT